MRPIKVGPYSPITALTTAFNAQTFNSTGAATAPTTTATTDLLAHLVTLVAPVQATLAGVTFTIVGTDANGAAQTETGLVGPASGATVTSTKHFKTITTIQPSATMGALVVSVGIAAESQLPMIPLEWRSSAGAAMTVDISGTINFTVAETYANCYNAAIEALPWVAITALTTKTADTSGTATVAANAVRLTVNTVTNGATVTWYISQAGGYLT
jgi:hypothetical protein